MFIHRRLKAFFFMTLIFLSFSPELRSGAQDYGLLQSSQQWDQLVPALRKGIDGYDWEAINWVEKRKNALYCASLLDHYYYNCYRDQVNVFDGTMKQKVADLLIIQQIRLDQDTACCKALRDKHGLKQECLTDPALNASCLLFKNKALDRWYSIMKEYKELKVPFASYKNTVNRIKELVSTWQDDSYCEDPSVILCCSKTYKYYFFSSTEISFNNPDSSLVSLFSRERELVAQTRKEEIENALERLERCNSWKDFFLSYALSSESESSALNKNSESSATHNDTTDTNQELSEQTAKLSLESVLIEHDEDSDGESY